MTCCKKWIIKCLTRFFIFVLPLIPILYVVLYLIFTKPINYIELTFETIGLTITTGSLLILIKKFVFSKYCGKNRFKKSAKKIGNIIDNYSADVVIYAGENSKNFIKEARKSIILKNIEFIDVSLSDLTTTFLKAYDFKTNKFYGTFREKYSLLNKRIIIFDDIIVTGETASSIKDYICQHCHAVKENILTISYGVYANTFAINKFPDVALNYFEVINHTDHRYYWR